MKVYEDDSFTVEQSVECGVPGYLVMRVKETGATLPRLDASRAARLGDLLARAARAIETVVGAERVYCLSFCEMDPRLHFHLFPRTRWLLDAYQKATGTAGQPVNGPALFEWARAAFPAGAAPASSQPDLEATVRRLRDLLAEGDR